MRALSLLIGVFLMALGAAAVALAHPAPSADLYLSKYPLAFTQLSVGGTRVMAMIDTGMQVPLEISPSLARRMHFRGKPAGTVQGYDFKPTVILAGQVFGVKLGGRELPSATAVVIGDQLRRVAAEVGTPHDAVVGWPPLSRYYVLLDYPGKRFALSPSPLPHAHSAWRLPYRVVNEAVQLRGTYRGRTVGFLLDTGSPSCAVDSRRFAVPAGSRRTFNFMLAGKAVRELCTGRDLSVNRRDGISAILGEELLSTRQVYFDPQRRLVSL